MDAILLIADNNVRRRRERRGFFSSNDFLVVAAPDGKSVLTRRASPGNYCIRLKVSAVDREDAWDLCRAALHYGGVEVHDCCFAFTTKERWLTALKALRFRFGPAYFEAVEPPRITP